MPASAHASSWKATPASTRAFAATPADTLVEGFAIDDIITLDPGEAFELSAAEVTGNTYSKLDTKRLIDFGKEAEGKDRIEAQMILNHKDAIEFLVTAAADIGFNRYTLLNLHGLL